MTTYDLIDADGVTVLQSGVSLNMFTPDLAPGQTWVPHIDINPPLTAEQQDIAYVRNHAKLAALRAMTPAHVEAWVTANVNTLAQAKDALNTLAVAVCILSRRI
jgi:hypothetical protein